jgi:hypothetical protein
MSFIKGNLVRKRIGEKFVLSNTEESDIKKFITNETYTTNGEYLLVIKNIQTCRITLDVDTTDHIIIKALTDVYIVPKQGLIDEQYSEIHIGNGACVEFYSLEGQWFIVSSDGLKLDEL